MILDCKNLTKKLELVARPGLLQDMDRNTGNEESDRLFKASRGTKHSLASKGPFLQEITNLEHASKSREISWTKAMDILAKSKSSSSGQHSLIPLSKTGNTFEKELIGVGSGHKNNSVSSFNPQIQV